MKSSDGKSTNLTNKPNFKQSSNLREFQVKEESRTSIKVPDQRVVGRTQSMSRQPTQSFENQVMDSQSNSNVGSQNLWSKWESELENELLDSRATEKPTEKSTEKSTVAQKTSANTMALNNASSIDNAITSSRELPWPAELALEERRMLREGVVDYSQPINQTEYVRKLSLDYVKNLQKNFKGVLEQFNFTRKDAEALAQIYRVSGTECDFMLFRNGVKLVVSAQKAGRVVFAFNQYLGQVYAPTSGVQSFELEAALGAFQQLHWTYRGERVSSEDVVRYFFTEFVKQSAR